jgi:hypothetical protein
LGQFPQLFCLQRRHLGHPNFGTWGLTNSIRALFWHFPRHGIRNVAGSLDHLIRLEEEQGGIMRPNALAVLRLMTNSNLVNLSTGRSVGFVPCKILAT